MSDVTNSLPDPYVVKQGDTLSSIARRSGQSLASLQRWNGIRDANKLSVGQTIHLSERSAFGVSALFLDALRHPIANLPFMLKFDGQTVTGRTSPSGKTPPQVTTTAQSQIEVWIQDARGLWQQIGLTTSDYGHKLLTLVSGAVVVQGRTEALPPGAAPKPPAGNQPYSPARGVSIRSTRAAGPNAIASKPAQKSLPAKTSGNATTNNPAVKTRRAKGPQGQAIIFVDVDIPPGLLELFALYQGAEITPNDWAQAAAIIDCDVAVLKAFAEVESGGHKSFWRLNKGDGGSVPAILFERHYFSRLTQRRYDETHPDISWRTQYRTKKQIGLLDRSMPTGKVSTDDVYGDYSSAYLRLINAYRLDANAALKACSWGKFQIMGANYGDCGETDIRNFVAKMCTSEAEQIKLVCRFIKDRPAPWLDPRNKKLGKSLSLRQAVQDKNWSAIAFNYNGPRYKDFSYDKKLQAAYEKYSKI